MDPCYSIKSIAAGTKNLNWQRPFRNQAGPNNGSTSIHSPKNHEISNQKTIYQGPKTTLGQFCIHPPRMPSQERRLASSSHDTRSIGSIATYRRAKRSSAGGERRTATGRSIHATGPDAAQSGCEPFQLGIQPILLGVWFWQLRAFQ